MGKESNRIVAAVGGEDSQALLDFAIEHALVTESDLHLVHVMQSVPALSGAFEAAYEEAHKLGRQVLDRAYDVARDAMVGKATVTAELVEDSYDTVDSIVTRSEGVRLVVLQHRHLKGLQRFTSGSTTYGVVARAHSPVASVPEGWKPAGRRHGRVTVGVQDPERADDTLRQAFSLAAQRGDTLRIVHAWWLGNGYDAIFAEDVDFHQDRDFRTALAANLDTLEKAYPNVGVEVSIQHRQTDLALQDATADSDLLVLGRRHHRFPLGTHLGSVTRFVLRSSDIPVVVVEPTRAD